MSHTLSIESPAIPMVAGRFALEPVRLSGTEGVHSFFSEITGEKAITIQSTEDSITIKARKSIALALDDGTYLRTQGDRVTWGMTGDYLVQTSNYRVNGPSTIGVVFPSFLRTDQAQQLKLHRMGDKDDTLANRAYTIVKASGVKSSATTGGDAISKLKKDTPFDVS